MPATTPSTWWLEAGCGPKRSESSSAIGRAPMAMTSRMMPPTPVAAPWYGSIAEGWLWDSILNTAAQPSPIFTAPAFSPGPWITAGLVDGSRRNSAFELLYEQCSHHSTPSIPSSTSLGARLSASTMARYSSGVSATSRRRRSSTTATGGALGERFRDQVVQMLGAAEHRSERSRCCVSEERRSQRRSWATRSPKIRRGSPPGAVYLSSRNQDLHRTRGNRAEEFEPIGAAERGLGTALRMRHHAQHVAACVDDAGDVMSRPVWVGAVRHAAARVTVAKDHLSTLLESRKRRGIGEVVALAMADRDAQHLTLGALRGERKVGALDDEVRPLAAVLQRGVADERAGQQTGLTQDLEPVADAPHQSATIGEVADLFHHGRKPGDRSRAKVVAVGEAARNDDAVATLEVRVLVPQVLKLGSEHLVDHPPAVAIRPRTGEDHDPEFHEWPALEVRRRFAASAAGAKEPTSTRRSASRRCVTERAQEATPASAPALAPAKTKISWGGPAPGRLGREDARTSGGGPLIGVCGLRFRSRTGNPRSRGWREAACTWPRRAGVPRARCPPRGSPRCTCRRERRRPLESRGSRVPA